MINFLKKQIKKNKIVRLILYYFRNDKLKRLMSSFLPKTICVDIGASYFPHSKWGVFLHSKNCLWIASDPNDQNMNYINHPNDWKCKFHIVDKAIDKDGGEKNFYITNVDSGSSIKEISVSSIMSLRLDLNYFFPFKQIAINTISLNEVLNLSNNQNDSTPIFLKLDTQGSELDILTGVKDLIKKKIILGVEIESSLLAETCYINASKFHKVNSFFENHDYELIKLDVFTTKNSLENKKKSFVPNECDSVFALKHHIIKNLSIDFKKSMLAFYCCYYLYQEMKILLDNNPDLQEQLEKDNIFRDINHLIEKKLNN
jgi:FkbM family methyltransferase